MGMLAEDVDHVIGVDTHRDAHSAAIVAVTGVVVAHRAEPANPFGYKRLLRFARRHTGGPRRVWAIESSGSYGAGLAAFLLERGEWVVEVEIRPLARYDQLIPA